MATKEAVLALFEQRFDYYSASTVLGESLARAGLGDPKDYGQPELERLIQGLLLTGHGMLDRLIAGLRSLAEPPAGVPVHQVAAPEVPAVEAPPPVEELPPAEESPAVEEPVAEAPETEPEEDAKPKAKKKR